MRQVDCFNDGWVYLPREVAPDTPWDDLAAGEQITLPHTWNAADGQDGGNDYRRGAGSYAKRFTAEPGDGETWLEFRGANSSADVYLNGRRLADHEGGYSTFRVDLTPALAAENTLVVVADNSPDDTVYPQRADFTFYGGIYRDVHLVRVPVAHFRLDDHGGPGVTVTPELDGSVARVMLRAEVTGGEAVRFTIDGATWQTVEAVEGVAETVLRIEDVRRWQGLRDPYLYLAIAELLVDGELADTVSLRFGCREFAVDPDRGFLLNGEVYPLRGVARHQDWEGVGNAVTPAMMETDLELLLELGATTVRLAHYQHDQRFYDLCDEAGIVVWAEIPQITEFLPDARSNAARQLTELIVQNRHHASIVCWAISNEITFGGLRDEILPAHRELNDLAHRLDPARPTAIAHVSPLAIDDPLVHLTDVVSYNLYYGWYEGELADNDRWVAGFHAAHPGVPIGLSEYGADGNPRFQTGEPVRGDYSETYQARHHEHMLDLIDASPFLWATHVWALADFGTDAREEGDAPGRNQKGLVSFDRRLKKDAYHLYKAAWSAEPFVHLAGRRYVDRPEEVTEVTVYSNQPQVTLWRDGELVGTRAGRRVFRFEVRLEGEHELTARSGDLADTIRVRRVARPNPAYAMPAEDIRDWFVGVGG